MLLVMLKVVKTISVTILVPLETPECLGNKWYEMWGIQEALNKTRHWKPLFFSRNFNKNQWWCYCKACCCLLLRFFFCMIGKTEPEQWQQWQIFIAFFLKYDCKVLISSIKILEVCASISVSKGAVKKWSIFVRKM